MKMFFQCFQPTSKVYFSKKHPVESNFKTLSLTAHLSWGNDTRFWLEVTETAAQFSLITSSNVRFFKMDITHISLWASYANTSALNLTPEMSYGVQGLWVTQEEKLSSPDGRCLRAQIHTILLLVVKALLQLHFVLMMTSCFVSIHLT